MFALIIALLSFQASPSPAAGNDIIILSRGNASISLPSDWTIDHGKANIENVVYTLRRRDSELAALTITLIGSSRNEDIGPHPKNICVNGLRGTTTVEGVTRHVLLELPQIGSALADHEVLFDYCASDQAAWRIVETFHLRAGPQKCR